MSSRKPFGDAAKRFLRALLFAGVTVFLPADSAGNTNAASSGFETWEEISQRWSRVSPEQLRQAAEAGKADAQHYLATIEWQAASEARDLAYDQWAILARTNTARAATAESTKLPVRTNWFGVPELEIRQAAVSGDRGAQRHLSLLAAEKAAERGRTAFEWWKRAAAQSFVPAEYQLAVRYLGVLGWAITPHDTEEGLKWLRKAVAGGFPSAQNRLAEMLIRGDVVPADLPAAITLLRLAADGGSTRAQFNLAQQYAVGHGEPRTSGETPVALFRKAAEAGVPEAQFALAERCRMGLGIAKDYFEAAAWYRKAAASGQLPGVRSLRQLSSLLNERGEVVRADEMGDPKFVEAFQLHFKATKQRDVDSQCRIAELYLRGQEAEHYIAKACFWYSVAASSSRRAAEERDRLKASLAAEDRQRVERWLEEFNRPPVQVNP